MPPENRGYRRFEPPFVDATICFDTDDQLRCSVLDSSRRGMAVALPEHSTVPKTGTRIVGLKVYSDDQQEVCKTIRSATVLRTWSDTGWLRKQKGLAIQFDHELQDDGTTNCLLLGVEQKTRLATQLKLAPLDISYLGDYRRGLIDCQMRLFILTLTAGVGLAGAYFGLTYHSIATGQIADPNLGFWRTMVAALPGFLAVACALMVAQKSISIQRMDAYLSILKECFIRKQFPREYRGWEIDYRKFRHVLNTQRCVNCKLPVKCGSLTPKQAEDLKNKNMYKDPKLDFYYILINMSFCTVGGLSLIAVLSNILTSEWKGSGYMISSFIITITLVMVFVGLSYIFHQLRKGRYSFDYFKGRWINVLERCREPV
jgi:hypothetical protein